MLPDTGHLTLFITATLVLLAIPGPAVLYIVAQSVEHGRRAGLTAVGGIHVGSLVHVAAATVGLSALLVSSAVAFSAVKFVGALYLIYLGVQRLRGRDSGDGPEVSRELDMRRVFRQGIVVNILNPKTALFFLAFLPQFVHPEAGSPAVQIVLFGLTLLVLGLTSDMIYAFTAGALGHRLARRARTLRHFSGVVYLGLGVATAFAGRK
jgi:threonine/homoserine/homoserine lactone efflux protein